MADTSIIMDMTREEMAMALIEETLTEEPWSRMDVLSKAKNLAVPLPSVAASVSPRQAWQHLGRCGRIEAGSLKVAQEKLSSLDVNRSKAATTSPSPIQEPQQIII